MYGDAIPACSEEYALPGFVTLAIGYAVDLPEARNGISHVACVLNRLLALRRECEFPRREVIPSI
jgi:hypothetical protein